MKEILKKMVFLLLIFFTGLHHANAQLIGILPCDENVFVPNVFTGNDDGIPQPFTVTFKDSLPSWFSLTVFTRFGETVFASNDPLAGWNGKYFNRGNVLEDGTYFWMLSYQWKNEKQKHYCQGNVNCIGLEGMDSPLMDSINCNAVYVPNYFTPNSETPSKELFTPEFACPPLKYEMWIFDRWGNQVFETKDYSMGWDGKVNGHYTYCDFYVWKIKCVYQVGDQEHVFTGRVAMIR